MKYLNMDGELHSTEGSGDNERDCCTILGKQCFRCGGFVHGQPVWSGIAESCENCDAKDWADEPDPQTERF